LARHPDQLTVEEEADPEDVVGEHEGDHTIRRASR
jgi:hypothetical protein